MSRLKVCNCRQRVRQMAESFAGDTDIEFRAMRCHLGCIDLPPAAVVVVLVAVEIFQGHRGEMVNVLSFALVRHSAVC